MRSSALTPAHSKKKLSSLPSVQAAHGSTLIEENRLLIRDKNSGFTFLVDSGSVVSLLPSKIIKSTEPLVEQSLKLAAANMSSIATYGRAVLTLNLGLRRDFKWPFIIADVQGPIIGADFLAHAGLLVDLQNMRLIDTTTTLSAQGQVSTVAHHSVAILHDPTGDIACRRDFDALLVEFSDITKPSDRRATLNGTAVKHYIHTTGPPVYERPRPLHGDRLKGAKQAFKELIDRGIARPSSSQWASPLHLVHKGKGIYRVTGDYRGINAVTDPDRYPLPIIGDLLHECFGGVVFSVVDLEKAFYQIPMAEEDIAKTAVTTPFGLIEFLTMPLGLRNAAQTFQRFMDTLLRDLPFVRNYLDDIIIFSKNHAEHLLHLRQLFQVLLTAGLSVNLDKCQIAQLEVIFLGYQVSKDGFQPPPKKVDAIERIHRPKTFQEVRSFLGMINYYRRCIPNAAQLQVPLDDLLRRAPKRKTAKLKIWTSVQEDAFLASKQALRNAVANSFLAPDSPLTLFTDASDTAIGAALEQSVDGSQQPVGFFSRKLTDIEKRYSTLRQRAARRLRSCPALPTLLGRTNFRVEN